MSLSRFPGMSPCVLLLALAAAAPPARAQEDADKNALLKAWKQGYALQQKGKYQEAIKEYETALALAPRVYGNDHVQTAAILNNLASLYKDMGQYVKAEPLCQRSLKIREDKLGPDHPDVAQSLNNLAFLYQTMGQYAKAEPLYQRSLKIREDKLGPDHPDVATSLNNLANLYRAMGQYTKAEPLYQRSLKIREVKLGPDHPDVAMSLNSLANLYRAMGQYAKAEPLFQRCLKIREDKLGPDHPAVATSLNNLANLYRDMGQYAKAEPLYQRSLKIWEDKLGPDHPNTAENLNNLALLYHDMGQYAKAEPLFQRCLKILEDKLGPDHPDLAMSLNNLAILYSAMGQYAKAKPLYQRSLKIREAQLGPDHPHVAMSLNNLANLYRAMGQYAKAEPLYQRSLKIWEDKLGPDHPDVAKSLNSLGLLHAAQEQWDEAGGHFQRQRRNVRRHVAQVLPILTEKEQLDFLTETDEKYFHNGLSLGLLRRGDARRASPAAQSTSLAELSAGWLVNGKAVAHQALAERALLEREAGDPRRRADVLELKTVRQQRAALSLAGPKPGQEQERLRQLAALAERQQDLERRLGRSTGFQPVRADPWIELGEVRKALAADAVFIDIARFRVTNFQATGQDVHEGKAKYWQPARYAAWIVFAEPASRERERPETSVIRIVDLGPADKIEAAVQAVRAKLRETQSRDPKKNPILQKGEPEAEEELRLVMAELSKLVLEPLLEHIGDKKEWIISPDAALWLVPWAALPVRRAGSVSDRSYAIEKYRIRYAVSGRDLVTPAAKTKATRPMVMADPDYDLGLAEARAAARELLDERVALADLRGVSATGTLPIVNRLPGTAAEAAAIKPKLALYAGEDPWVYKDKNALEAVFKSFKSPKVLVLSTHGFFMEDQVVAETARSALPSEDSGSRLNGAGSSRPVLTKDGKPLENPLLRCGLLLAGCNDREGTRTDTDEDGVLTGLEIVGTDLRGTELVVLSACETGLGQVRNGEGVAGLRQAFQLAGAQAVVATLWQIPDRDSALLMSDFFDNLAAGKSKADALREAQLTRIKARRERHGAAHPFFWAAFTLTGE